LRVGLPGRVAEAPEFACHDRGEAGERQIIPAS
jgi:hypothetical protein